MNNPSIDLHQADYFCDSCDTLHSGNCPKLKVELTTSQDIDLDKLGLDFIDAIHMEGYSRDSSVTPDYTEVWDRFKAQLLTLIDKELNDFVTKVVGDKCKDYSDGFVDVGCFKCEEPYQLVHTKPCKGEPNE